MVALDTETDSLDALRRQAGRRLPRHRAGPGLLHPAAPCGAGGSQGDMLAAPEAAPPQIPFDDAMAALRPLLEDRTVLKVLQNAKYDLEVLAGPENGGIAVAPIDDTMLISYAMEAGRARPRHGRAVACCISATSRSASTR